MLNSLLADSGSSLSQYDPFSLRPQIISIALVTLILVVISVIYFVKQSRLKPNEAPHGIVLIIEIFVKYIRGLINEILGPRFDKATPYFIYLMSYILLSNVIGILGFENPTSSLTVTLSLGLVTFIGTIAIGLAFQKASFFKKYFFKVKIKGKQIPFMINPVEIISTFTPLISISFRLWGNVFAGSLITSMWFFLMAYISAAIPILGVVNILAGLTAPPIHGYFDLLCGCIQALVFTLLTMVYWTLSTQVEVFDFPHTDSLNKVDNLNINNK